jgi:hypothetical protein
MTCPAIFILNCCNIKERGIEKRRRSTRDNRTDKKDWKSISNEEGQGKRSEHLQENSC